MEQKQFDDTWYPIDTAPTTGLLIVGKGSISGLEVEWVLMYYDTQDQCWRSSTGILMTPTHWRYTRKDQYLKHKQQHSG